LANRLLNAGYPLSVSSTSLLFFFRVKAVYSNRKPVTIFFFCLWLMVVGCTMTVPFAMTSGNIGPTPYCINLSAKSWITAATWGTLIHDSAVTLAISLRLLQNSYVDYDSYDHRARVKLIFSGSALPRLSRTIFQDGQLYYWRVMRPMS
jgi:hypothetical protein